MVHTKLESLAHPITEMAPCMRWEQCGESNFK